MLKELIVGCATAVALVQLYLYGDGTVMAALFTLYGSILGVEVGKFAENRQKEG